MNNHCQDFFIADTHFGHSNIIAHCARPFTDAADMEVHLIREWNDTVKNTDRVFVLGDFSFLDWKETQRILTRLNGQKFLIKGNHDSSKMLKQLTAFTKITAYDELKFKDRNEVSQRIVMSHFPFLSWNGMHRGAYHFHGHCHGSLILPESLVNARIFDVGVDNLAKVFGRYAPVSREKLLAHLANHVSSSVDHHAV